MCPPLEVPCAAHLRYTDLLVWAPRGVIDRNRTPIMRAMFKRTTHYLWPYRRQWATHIVLALTVSGLQLATPWPMKILVDSVLGNVALPAFIRDTLAPNTTNDKLVLLSLV